MPHAAELHSPVRALAHRLASGKMSWADYREQRAMTVDAIVRGDDPLNYSQAVVFEDTTMPKEHELSQVYIDVDALEREPKRWLAGAAVGLLAVVLLAAAWVLWRSSEPPVVAEAPVVVMTGAEAALKSFLDDGDWSAASLDQTVTEWSQFSDAQQDEARRTATWRRLQSRLREQINQQRVLATVDESGDAAAQGERLVEFQQALQE
ncbi:MAG: hypothetical protein WD081_02170 [Gammaproteobacteria bacterium]